uniref:Amine oxidase domain-containing protein n=1 Tax=viral metagenome TaxID=1070528 RepID=A0A6C0DHQ2_9ZZZZ
MRYDLVIVGAGVAGLTVGLETLKKNPSCKILIVEQYDYVGGRVLTHHQGSLSWEAGAGRIGNDHVLTHELIKRYGLKTYPIGNSDGSLYIRDGTVQQNPFTDLLATMLLPLSELPPSVLATHTLAELMTEVYGPKKAAEYYNMFPYWSEIHTLRADLAIHSFQTEFGSKATYSVIAGGFSQIATGLAADFKRLGGKFQFKTTVSRLEKDAQGFIICSDRPDILCRACVLAIPSVAVKKIGGLQAIPALTRLAMEPLVRMYAVFKDKDWLKDLTKIVSDSRVRYTIPISAEKGIVMISYTDGADAHYWIKFRKEKGEDAVKDAVMKGIRKLLPDKDIGEPTEFVIHPWSNGCTYWLPGSYDPVAVLKDSLNPGPNLFVCGESFSMRQAWVEGALESALTLLKLPAFQKELAGSK